MTMDVQTVFIGALILCKPGVVDEIIPDLELDLFRPELRDAFAAVQGYWTARGKIDIVEINTQHTDVAQTLLACVQTCESECVRIDREQMWRSPTGKPLLICGLTGSKRSRLANQSLSTCKGSFPLQPSISKSYTVSQQSRPKA